MRTSWPLSNGPLRQPRIASFRSSPRGEVRHRRHLSPVVAERLRDVGHDAVHVTEIGLLTAADEVILAAVAEDDRVIVSADADFAALIALGHLPKPSLVLLRSADHLTPTQQADLLLVNLPGVADDLEQGAIVTTARGRLRVRQLPIEP